jgi:hypothetical protein
MTDILYKHVPATYHHVPRTAGTSLKLWTRENIKDFEEAPLPEFTPANIDLVPNYDYMKTIWPNMGTRFTFVRNPFSRLVSLYHFVGQIASNRLIEYRQYMHDKQLPDNWKRYPYQSDNLVSCIIDDTKLIEIYRKGFDYYLYCLSNPNEWYDNIRPNSYHLVKSFWHTDTQESLFCGQLPDIVIRMEDLATEFVKVQDLLQCNAPLPHVNATEHNNYQSYYTAQDRQLVSKMFAKDLATFKYEF